MSRDFANTVERIAVETTFSGAVRVDRGDEIVFEKAYGYADRAHEIANAVDTQFAIASGGKGLTALTVVSLVEDGALDWRTTARSMLGSDLPLIDERVTVEHLLAHRSGIGDYLDEEDGHAVTDYVLPVPVHQLASTEDYLAVLDGKPPKFAPGERFAYSNSGYVVLAVIAERATGASFHELVRKRVCEPAEMHDTEFLRSDELPARAALGYLSANGRRTNVLHLPVRGSGDGGIYSTVADVHAFWRALFDGRMVSMENVTRMIEPRSELPTGTKRYGLGFWLAPSGTAVVLEGYDAGVSFRSSHEPQSHTTFTVIANTSEGAWPLVRHLDQLFPDGPS